MKRKDIEIMAPAGSYESLMAAIQAGADSVYFGVEQLNMRAASSNNFTLDDLQKYCYLYVLRNNHEELYNCKCCCLSIMKLNRCTG